MEFIALISFMIGAVIGFVLTKIPNNTADMLYRSMQEHNRLSENNSRLHGEINILQRQIMLLAKELSKYIKDQVEIYHTIQRAKIKAMQQNTLTGGVKCQRTREQI